MSVPQDGTLRFFLGWQSLFLPGYDISLTAPTPGDTYPNLSTLHIKSGRFFSLLFRLPLLCFSSLFPLGSPQRQGLG